MSTGFWLKGGSTPGFLVSSEGFNVGDISGACGCCEEGPCVIHAYTGRVGWKIRKGVKQNTAKERHASRILALGQVSQPPYSSVEIITSPVNLTKYIGDDTAIPPWDTRAWTLTSLAISTGSYVQKVSADKYHEYNGTNATPTSFSWASFYSLVPGISYPLYGVPTGPGDPPNVYDKLIVTGGATLLTSLATVPAIASAPNFAGAVFGTSGAAQATIVLRMNLDTKVIELVSYSALKDSGGAAVVGGTLGTAFPVSLANDNTNVAHAFSVACTVKDSGGATVGTFTAAGSITRSAYGVVSIAAKEIVSTSSIALFTVPALGAGPNDILQMAATPIKTWASGTLSAAPDIRIEFKETFEAETLWGDNPDRDASDMKLTFSQYAPAADLVPNFVLSGSLSGTISGIETTPKTLTYTVRPWFADLVFDGANVGTGTRTTIYSDGRWTLGGFVTSSAIDVLDLFPGSGYTSASVPAGQPVSIAAYASYGLNAGWRGTDTIYYDGASNFVSLSCDIVSGGVPSTITFTGDVRAISDNAAVPGTLAPTVHVIGLYAGVYRVGASTSGTGSKTTAIATESDKSAISVFSINPNYQYVPANWAMSVSRSIITSVGGVDMTSDPCAVSWTPVPLPIATDTKTIIPAAVDSSDAFFIYEALRQRWAVQTDITAGFTPDTDAAKVYGPLRFKPSGCLNAAMLNGWLTLVSSYETEGGIRAAGTSTDDVRFWYYHDSANAEYACELSNSSSLNTGLYDNIGQIEFYVAIYEDYAGGNQGVLVRASGKLTLSCDAAGDGVIAKRGAVVIPGTSSGVGGWKLEIEAAGIPV